MSKRCPHCGSYNTEAAIENYVERGIVNIGRVLLTAGATTVGSLVNPVIAQGSGREVWKNTEPGEFHGHRCCNCGKEF